MFVYSCVCNVPYLKRSGGNPTKYMSVQAEVPCGCDFFFQARGQKNQLVQGREPFCYAS